MIINRQPISRKKSLWISFKKESQSHLLNKCVEEIQPLLKSVRLNNELLIEEFSQDKLASQISGSLNKSLGKISRLISQFSSLSKLYAGSLPIRLTEEVPSLILGEINDLSNIRIKLIGQNKPGIKFLADHNLLVDVLDSLFQEVKPEQGSCTALINYSLVSTSIKIDLGKSCSKQWEETVTGLFIHEALDAMQGSLTLGENSLELTFKSVS